MRESMRGPIKTGAATGCAKPAAAWRAPHRGQRAVLIGSLPRQEIYFVGHGFEQHIFIDFLDVTVMRGTSHLS